MAAALAASLALVAPGPKAQGEDLVQDYVSARALLTGEEPYQPLQPLRARMGLPTPERYHMKAEYNPHPPMSVLLATPVAWLPFEPAYLIVRIVQIVLLAVAWVWASSLVGIRSVPWSIGGGIVLGAWPPVWGGLDWGQPTGLIALLSVALFHLVGRPRPVACGALLTVACLVRPFYAAVAAAAGAWKPRDIAIAAASAIAVAAGSFLLVGVTPWEWLRRASTANAFATTGESLPSILGLPTGAAIAGFALWLAFVALLARLGLPSRRAAALGLSGGMLWYPLAWFHYDVALIPIALWAGSLAVQQRRWIPIIMVGGYVALRFVPPYQSIPGSMTWLPVCGRTLLLGACGILCVLARPPASRLS